MMWRVGAVVVYVLLGLGVGFFLWGSRVSNLTAALNRMMLEDDTLRAHLARQQDTGGNDDTALLATLSLLSAEVSMQKDLIAKQSSILDKLTTGREKKLEASLSKCNAVESRMQKQLESCLFTKASLEKDVDELQRAAAPRHGAASFETTTRSAEEVLEEARGQR